MNCLIDRAIMLDGKRNLCLYLFVIALTSIGCKKGPPDGTYCAKINFVNKQTNNNSTLTILTDVRNNEVMSFSFPDSHYDKSSIKAIKIPEDGKFSVMSLQGTTYQVQMIGKAEKCKKALNMAQCKGLAKNGKRCNRYTDHKNGLCWQHKSQK